MTARVRVTRLPGYDCTIALPMYESPGAAGADLRANLTPLDRPHGITLAPGERALIPTGLSMEIPPGYEAQVRPRSGLASKHGVDDRQCARHNRL